MPDSHCPECAVSGVDQIVSLPSGEKPRENTPWFYVARCADCGYVYGVFTKHVFGRNSPLLSVDRNQPALFMKDRGRSASCRPFVDSCCGALDSVAFRIAFANTAGQRSITRLQALIVVVQQLQLATGFFLAPAKLRGRLRGDVRRHCPALVRAEAQHQPAVHQINQCAGKFLADREYDLSADETARARRRQ